jgi:hypothetical protein
MSFANAAPPNSDRLRERPMKQRLGEYGISAVLHKLPCLCRQMLDWTTGGLPVGADLPRVR